MDGDNDADDEANDDVPYEMNEDDNGLNENISGGTAAVNSKISALKDSSRLLKKMPLLVLVRVFVTKIPPDWIAPWRKPQQKRSTATGFVLNGKIVTNAHVVRNCTNIRVRQHGQTRKCPATVRAVCEDADLAILSVEDDERFWKTAVQCRLRDDVPALGEEVACVGYPKGDHASVTKGVVSRCVLSNFLTVQIDAAINAGNSGGPVFDKNGLCVGVAHAHLRDAQNICYAIPTEVLRVFMEMSERDPENSRIGTAGLGIDTQTLENDDMRRSLGLVASHHDDVGILVSRVLPFSPAHGVLEIGDVILTVDGYAVGSDGTVTFREAERINWMYLIRRNPLGKTVALTFLRARSASDSHNVDSNGQSKDGTPTNGNGSAVLMKRDLRLDEVVDKIPRSTAANCVHESWVVVGGLVFLPANEALLSKLKKSLPIQCSNTYWEFANDQTEQTIVLAQVLVDDVNFGYHGWYGLTVSKINGVAPKSLAHFGRIVYDLGLGHNDPSPQQHQRQQPIDGTTTESPPDDTKPIASSALLDLSFVGGKKIILDCDKCKATESRIAEQYSIPTMMSKNVMEQINVPE